MRHMWKNPPRCVGLLARKAPSRLRKEMIGSYDNITVFQLRCVCGAESFHVEGKDYGPYPGVTDPISVVCSSCGERRMIFRQVEHGWEGELGEGYDSSFLPDKTLLCPERSHNVFRLGVSFQYRGNEEEELRQQSLEKVKAPQDMFGWFTALAHCCSCGASFVATTIECR